MLKEFSSTLGSAGAHVSATRRLRSDLVKKLFQGLKNDVAIIPKN
jgi:hypothetical protein